MDDRISTPLPVWLVAENGALVNLAQVERLTTDYVGSCSDEDNSVGVLAVMTTGRVLLATCADAEQANAALKKLERLLPIAVVDMMLDVIAPLEHEAREQDTEAE